MDPALLLTLIIFLPSLGALALVVFPRDAEEGMRQWSLFFAEHPVLLSPTWAQPAFEHGADAAATVADDMLATIRPVLPMNLLGLPAAVVPGGMADGLPVGVQVIGDRFTDLRCLAIAQQVEDALGAITPIDPVLATATGQPV